MARWSHLSGLLFLAPKFWEVVGAYESFFCSKKNTARVVWTITGDGDTQTLLAGKKIELLCKSQAVEILRFFLVPGCYL